MFKLNSQKTAVITIAGVFIFCCTFGAFATDKFEVGNALNKKLSVRLSSFFATTKTKIQVDSKDGVIGEEISFEDDLNLPDRETLPLLDITYRFNPPHMVDFSYVNLGRDATNTFQRSGVTTDNIEWVAGSEIQSRFDSETFRLAYGYSFLQDQKKELGISAGLHLTRFNIKMTGEGSLVSVDENGNEVSELTADGKQTFETNFNAPLPVVGVRGAYAFTPKLHARGWGQFFLLDYDEYSGGLVNAAGMLEYDLTKNVGIGLGYAYYSYNLDLDKDNLKASFDYDFKGPTAFLYWGF